MTVAINSDFANGGLVGSFQHAVDSVCKKALNTRSGDDGNEKVGCGLSVVCPGGLCQFMWAFYNKPPDSGAGGGAVVSE